MKKQPHIRHFALKVAALFLALGIGLWYGLLALNWNGQQFTVTDLSGSRAAMDGAALPGLLQDKNWYARFLITGDRVEKQVISLQDQAPVLQFTSTSIGVMPAGDMGPVQGPFGSYEPGLLDYISSSTTDLYYSCEAGGFCPAVEVWLEGSRARWVLSDLPVLLPEGQTLRFSSRVTNRSGRLVGEGWAPEGYYGESAELLAPDAAGDGDGNGWEWSRISELLSGAETGCWMLAENEAYVWFSLPEPWNVSRIYRVTTTEQETLYHTDGLAEGIDQVNTTAAVGSSTLLAQLPAGDVILGLAPAADGLGVVVQRAQAVWLLALDRAGTVQDETQLYTLPAGQEKIGFTVCSRYPGQPETDLSFIYEFGTPDNRFTAATAARIENGRITAARTEASQCQPGRTAIARSEMTGGGLTWFLQEGGPELYRPVAEIGAVYLTAAGDALVTAEIPSAVQESGGLFLLSVTGDEGLRYRGVVEAVGLEQDLWSESDWNTRQIRQLALGCTEADMEDPWFSFLGSAYAYYGY